MKCNRTACRNDAQGWWNRYTQAFYCQPCAFRINDSSKQSGLGEICAKQVTNMLNNAPLLCQWDPGVMREVEECKLVYQQARREGRRIESIDDHVEVEHFHPDLGGFRVAGRALKVGEFALRVLNETGDETLTWDADDPSAVKEAAEVFEKYKKEGRHAFAVGEDGSLRRRIEFFDAEAQEIVFTDVITKEKFKTALKEFVSQFAAPMQVTAPTRAG